MEVLIAVVDDVVFWSACPDETQTLKQTMNNLHGSVLVKSKSQCCGEIYACKQCVLWWKISKHSIQNLVNYDNNVHQGLTFHHCGHS